MSSSTPSLWKTAGWAIPLLIWTLNSRSSQGFVKQNAYYPALNHAPYPQNTESGPGQAVTTPLRWGVTAPALTLKDSLNRRVSFRKFRNRQVLLLVFSHYSCPAHHLYLSRLLALEPQLKKLNGEAIWVFPHRLDRDMVPPGQTFPLQDRDGKTFDAYGIRKTPHVVVLQKISSSLKGRSKDQWKICYSGSVDADPEGLQPSVRPDLAEALRDLEFSDYVRIPQTPLHGCPHPNPNHP